MYVGVCFFEASNWPEIVRRREEKLRRVRIKKLFLFKRKKKLFFLWLATNWWGVIFNGFGTNQPTKRSTLSLLKTNDDEDALDLEPWMKIFFEVLKCFVTIHCIFSQRNLTPPSSFQRGPKLVPKWSQTGPKLVPNWSQRGPKGVPSYVTFFCFWSLIFKHNLPWNILEKGSLWG